MKNILSSLFILFLSFISEAQYIDSVKLNLNSTPSCMEIYCDGSSSGWKITNLTFFGSDTIYVSLYLKECGGFIGQYPFDTTFCSLNLPTVPAEIVVYSILDTNTSDTLNCEANYVLDTLFTYTSFQSNVGLEKNRLSSVLSLFPNPAKNQVELSGITLNEISEIKLIDLSGRLIRKFPLDNFVLDLSGVDKGNYFIQLQTEYGPRTEKLVVD